MFTEYDDGTTQLLGILAIFAGGIITCILNGLVGMVIGSFKNNRKAGFWFGFFLSIIGWLIAALLPDNRDRNTPPSRNTVRPRHTVEPQSSDCPHCTMPIPDELILRGLRKCPHCSKTFNV